MFNQQTTQTIQPDSSLQDCRPDSKDKNNQTCISLFRIRGYQRIYLWNGHKLLYYNLGLMITKCLCIVIG